jgi:hypothetical protein
MPHKMPAERSLLLPDDVRNSMPQGRNYLLLIGIDAYAHCPRLSNAVADARAVREVLLEKYQFEPGDLHELYDAEATKIRIQSAFRTLAGKVTPQDNVLIYFSGHGFYDRLFEEGYWIPVEGRYDGGTDYSGDYLANSAITSYLRGINSFHTFLVADSCFSGSIFTATRDLAFSEKLGAVPSRWGLSSGMVEPVADGFQGQGSPFANYFIECLRQNSGPYLLTSDLIQYVKKAVGMNARQQPVGSRLFGVDDRGQGEFIFLARQLDPAAQAWFAARAAHSLRAYLDFIRSHGQSPYATEAYQAIEALEEAEAWEKARAQQRISAYLAYLRKYPQGSHAAQAEEAIRALEEGIADPPPAPAPPLPRPLAAVPPAESKALPPGSEQLSGKNCYEEGEKYYYGRGVARDYSAAAAWYRAGAEKGYPAAQHDLAYMYEHGSGLPASEAEAVKWYRKAAANGMVSSMNNLGLMYKRGGAGLMRDYGEAMNWFRKAADEGFAIAQYNVAIMYRDGEGVEQDYAEAARWYELAAAQGDLDAVNNLGVLYQNGWGVKQNLEEAYKRYFQAANLGHSLAQNNLGSCYRLGMGVPQDYVEALKWYRLSADQGCAEGEFHMGFMYDNALGVAEDPAKALIWYERAAAQGDSDAMVNLGILYKDGRGVKQDLPEAVRCFRQAAEQGHALGQVNLGFMYENGLGIARDDAEAVAWYRKAAARQHPQGLAYLADMLENGRGVAQDLAEAIRLYEIAARLEEPFAQTSLKRLGRKW